MGSRNFANHNSMVSLKVDNISYRTTIEELRPLFEKYGDIGDIYIPRDKYTKESRGFAFVRFYEKRDAEEAMDRLDGHSIDGRDIRVSRAMHPRPVSRYRGGGGGGGGGGRYRGGGGYSSRRRSYSRSRSRSRSRDRRRRSYTRSRSPDRRSRSRDSRSPPKRSNRSRTRSHSRSRSRSNSRGRR